MNYSQLVEQIYKKKSFLCVGLDTDFNKLPKHLQQLGKATAFSTFNKAIVDATAPYAVAFKPNVAFYESEGIIGWKALEETISYIKAKYPEILVIADAKRGDIGNTSKMYAKTFFETLNADAVTVAPYMGCDSVSPFLQYDDKWTIILGLTSNQGSFDFQHIYNTCGFSLHQIVINKASQWGCKENTMFVVGATQANQLESIRAIIPDHFLLVPGVGAQGGSLADVAKYGMNDKHCALLVNSSRGIIYAGHNQNFAQAAAVEAAKLQQEMEALLQTYSSIENA